MNKYKTIILPIIFGLMFIICNIFIMIFIFVSKITANVGLLLTLFSFLLFGATNKQLLKQ